MLNVYLTDLNKTVSLDLGHGTQDIAQVMRLKKVFLSTMDLLEPVIPDNQDISRITWRATQTDLKHFKQLAGDWQTLELRLRAYAAFAGKDAMDVIIQVAQQKRQARYDEAGSFAANVLELDVLMLATIHQQLDQLLAREKPYAASFLQEWPQFKEIIAL